MVNIPAHAAVLVLKRADIRGSAAVCSGADGGRLETFAQRVTDGRSGPVSECLSVGTMQLLGITPWFGNQILNVNNIY